MKGCKTVIPDSKFSAKKMDVRLIKESDLSEGADVVAEARGTGSS